MQYRPSSPPTPPSAVPAPEFASRACSPAWLFDCSGNPMRPSHAVKQGTRYCYYVSRPLITKASDGSAGLRLPAEAIEQLVTGSVRQWLLDLGSIYPVT